jgi:ABC-type multidrug transport system fused ATPase/permease subunit
MATTETAWSKLRSSAEWKFFGALPKAAPGLAFAWWGMLFLRGLLPALFALAVGTLVGAVERHAPLVGPLAFTGTVFVLLQVLSPMHRTVGNNLGSRLAAWLYDELTLACVSPPGMGHLEDQRLTTDLAMARDFDLGISGPPLEISMDFIAGGLVEVLSGIVAALLLGAWTWWAPLVLGGAWFATQWLLRESAVWKDRNTDEVRSAQRDADYAYRLAVDAPAAKELRMFGLSEWTVERFRSRRRKLLDLQFHATRLRERPLVWSLLLVLSANVFVFVLLVSDAMAGRLSFGQAVTFANAAVATSVIAFGGISWALDCAAAPVGAVLRLRPAMAEAGRLDAAVSEGGRLDAPVGAEAGRVAEPSIPVTVAPDMPAVSVRFRDVRFQYTGEGSAPVLDGLDLTIPAGTSIAIVGRNGAGKTTLAKLLCRLYDPQSGAVEIDGVDLRSLDLEAWRRRVCAVFQDFIRFELPLRENVAPGGAPDAAIVTALEQAGASRLAGLDTILAKGYDGGTDLSGGQWQRVALARALCAVQMGAGLVLLDEPTAQLDVRGEAEIFDRILQATRKTTTILISHRFSTVRHADRICVLEDGRVAELGTHDELMALQGRYWTMFEMQASRFDEASPATEEGVALDAPA